MEGKLGGFGASTLWGVYWGVMGGGGGAEQGEGFGIMGQIQTQIVKN